jgi:hypothetical protein
MTDSMPAAQPSRPPLYHYTDGNGFLGMLNRRRLWFSHIKYLNDSAEYSYALTRLSDVLGEYEEIDQYHHLRNAFKTISDNERLQNHYSFSLTEEKDLLSQWRGYCPNGGYSFAINDQHFEEMRTYYKLTFEKCLYDKEEQRQFIIDRIIGHPLDPLKQAFQREKESIALGTYRSKGMDLTVYNIGRNIITKSHLLAFLKHPTFEQEKEWRIIASENMTNRASYLQYRSSRNMLIPYLDVPILPDDSLYKELQINNVIVSPTPHQDLALASCRQMVWSYNCNYVQSSTIPYRNW